jgi:CRISPR/Cas system-associated protein Cas10 (large subunit of type III CRISPR-Cas system)
MKNSDICIDFVSSANKLNQFGEKKAKIKSEVKDQVKDRLKPLENTLVTDEKMTVNPDYKTH